MDLIITVDNFEDGGAAREINSPRSLEACLRSGLDPKELLPKPRGAFVSAQLTKEMVDAKVAMFEKKRKDKILVVRQERNAIIKFAMRKNSPEKQAAAAEQTGLLANKAKEGGSNLIEMVRFVASFRRLFSFFF